MTKKHTGSTRLPILASLGLSLSALAAPEASEILKKADAIRNPAEAYSLDVTIENSDGGKTGFAVKIKGGDKTLIRTVSPPKDRGRDLLMLGDDMWAYVPNLKRAVRVALQQKISGQAANGDIARTRWSSDYEAKIEQEDGDRWVLFLTARRKGLTYDKIRLWVQKQSYHPLKAEYLTLSGTALKLITFDNYKTMEGTLRPTLLLVKDAVQQDKTSRIVIEKMQSGAILDSVFSESQLGQP